eukprot:TRINITY_DN6634_c0_g2_i4.p1 TRINITY_DN6634_c0_g2~~TRINITY_DN6634_c0_g2_i4.p1  ORF type:complete len:786 (+),score=173.92 TRINITY_DN6634_c0_g2_i4:62-2419(+)
MASVLVIGSGGREHCIAHTLAQSAAVARIFVAPGNAATAHAPKLQRVPNIAAEDVDALLTFALANAVDLTIVGPEAPLVAGIVDAFQAKGLRCFGPSAKAAQLEASKAFSKDFMVRHGIPTAVYRTFQDFDHAWKFVQSVNYPVVIKASGLAAGKGVILPETKEEAQKALHEIMVDRIFGEAGAEVVVEERLTGPEASILAFTDGTSFVCLPAAQDHKRAYDGDQGPNTGGMGAYAPAPIVTPALQAEINETVIKRTIDGIRADGTPYVGVLYAGVMLTPKGVRVLEFNCRLGDPETQVVLPLLKTDLYEIVNACLNGELSKVQVEFHKESAVTLVYASEGYPGSYPKGKVITGLDSEVFKNESVTVFHAGTALNADGAVVTSGGRVLAVTSRAKTLKLAVDQGYEAISNIHFDGGFYRKDIAHRALSVSYADAGVNISEGNRFVDEIKAMTKSTARPGADADIGGFGGLFDLKAIGYKDPILVSTTDGVGTKLKIAQLVNKHDTIGIDLVGMSVNDLIVQGAEPLIFLDYFSTGKLSVEVAKDVVSGIAAGCRESRCALIGGETAEMPGMYGNGEYDLAGFSVGAVERDAILPRKDIQAGDVVIGLPSAGVHSNGYSLVRLLVEKSGLSYEDPCPFQEGTPLGHALLTPTKLYVQAVMKLCRVESKPLKGLAHITGGGLIENIPRVLPAGHGVALDASTWEFLPVFRWLQSVGNIKSHEMARTFNCGIGMIAIIDPSQVDVALEALRSTGETPSVIGRVIVAEEGHERVQIANMEASWGTVGDH